MGNLSKLGKFNGVMKLKRTDITTIDKGRWQKNSIYTLSLKIMGCIFVLGYFILPLLVCGTSSLDLSGLMFILLWVVVWSVGLVSWWRRFCRWPTEVKVDRTSVAFKYRKGEKNVCWDDIEKIDSIKLPLSWGWGSYESIQMKNGTKIPLQGVVDKTLIKEIRNQFQSYKQSQK